VHVSYAQGGWELCSLPELNNVKYTRQQAAEQKEYVRARMQWEASMRQFRVGTPKYEALPYQSS